MWGTYSEYGYYYQWYKDYSGNNVDPCTKLKSDYGTGWRTPSKDEMDKLSRCTDKAVVTNGGNKGFWFMNNTIGFFYQLPDKSQVQEQILQALDQKDVTGAVMLMVQNMDTFYIYYWW